MEGVIYGVLIVAGLWMSLALAGVAPLALLLFMPFKELHGEAAHVTFARTGGFIQEEWLRQQGFVRAVVLANAISRIVGWQHPRESRFAAVYLIGDSCNIDFITEFADEVSLTTGNSGEGVLFPRPAGEYIQALPGLSSPLLYHEHQLAEQAVQGAEGVNVRVGQNFADSFRRAVRTDVKRVLGRPWIWPMIPWWYFVRRHRWKGLRVTDQLARGWVTPRNRRWFA